MCYSKILKQQKISESHNVPRSAQYLFYFIFNIQSIYCVYNNNIMKQLSVDGASELREMFLKSKCLEQIFE